MDSVICHRFVFIVFTCFFNIQTVIFFFRKKQKCKVMIDLKGYSVKDQIYEGKQSLIFRALRKKDDRPTVLKLLKKEYPTSEEVARFKREYEMTPGHEPGRRY